MGKWILGAALVAWAGIIGFAYRLADARGDLCGNDRECRIPIETARDGILIAGLIIGLLGLIALAVLVTRSPRRLSRPANPARIIELN